jgi:hypothetical protein
MNFKGTRWSFVIVIAGVGMLMLAVGVVMLMIFHTAKQKSEPVADSSNISTSPESIPKDVAQLMEQEETLNDKCRGGSIDGNATQEACEEREVILRKIQAKNWCRGHDGQIGADRNWEPCRHDNLAQQANAGAQATASITQSQPSTVEPETQQNPPKMGRDGMAGGQADDKWQTVQSDGREIYVMTNGLYYSGRTPPPLSTEAHHSGYGFHTYIVANLPESDIVGAPQSVMNDVEGNCETRHYHLLGSLFFAGKNRSGMAMDSTSPEDVERKLVPNSPFEKAFDMLCGIAGLGVSR